MMVVAAILYQSLKKSYPPPPPAASIDYSVIVDSAHSAITDAEYVVDDKPVIALPIHLRPGSHTVAARAVGYVPVSQSFIVKAAKEMQNVGAGSEPDQFQTAIPPTSNPGRFQ